VEDILEFIKIFDRPETRILFTECACYWFSSILKERFQDSIIVYNPHEVHFATLIEGRVYDITGVVEDARDYISWEYYSTMYPRDAELVHSCCITFERR